MLTEADLRLVLAEYADLAPEPSGAQFRPAAPTRHTRRWVRPAIAAAGVALLAGGAAAWTATNSDSENAGGPGSPSTPACLTALPAAWSSAYRPLVVPGAPYVEPLAMTAQGMAIVEWGSRGGSVHVAEVAASGHVTTVYEQKLPPDDGVVRSSSDGKAVVLEISPLLPASGPVAAAPDDIVAIDLGSGRVSHLLTDMPHGYVASVSDVLALQDGTVYWPAQRDMRAGTSVLMQYDLSSRRFTTLSVDTGTLNWSLLGITWNGGGLAALNIPANVPALGNYYLSIATDGTAYAWSTYQKPGLIQWTDTSGRVRTVHQNVASHIAIAGVAGPYVFLNSGEGDDGDQIPSNVLYVLDTRSGAMAKLGPMPAGNAPANHGFIAFGSELTGSKSVHRLDTTTLPPLSC